ncbi:type II toxin-antitoxin system death-on-curing family toxin [Patescibacteria group bacterium]|nr:type II toxin-antitoxin system death-on-curing family toxin [Patescibacteria group bacterium]
MKRIFLSEIEILFNDLNQGLKERYHEKMPNFETRYRNVLESSLVVPFEEFGGKAFYESLPEKLAIIFYLLIKNHAFRDGNKRMALATLLFFLANNNKWLRAEEDELYDFILWVTESKPQNKNYVLADIEKFIIEHLVSYHH